MKSREEIRKKILSIKGFLESCERDKYLKKDPAIKEIVKVYKSQMQILLWVLKDNENVNKK